MMLYTKYECFGTCGFGQEYFWKLRVEIYIFTPWPTYATNMHRLNNFGGDHLGINTVEFGQIPISGSGDVKCKNCDL